MSIESVMPSSHLILCRPLLLLPPVPPSIRVFSNELTLRMRWTKYWSFSFSVIPSSYNMQRLCSSFFFFFLYLIWFCCHGQGGLVCCDSWGRKESDMTEQLNWTELNWITWRKTSQYNLQLTLILWILICSLKKAPWAQSFRKRTPTLFISQICVICLAPSFISKSHLDKW